MPELDLYVRPRIKWTAQRIAAAAICRWRWARYMVALGYVIVVLPLVPVVWTLDRLAYLGRWLDEFISVK